MAKQREKSEVEYLRASVRSLEKENKKLKKEVSRLEKRSFQYEDLESREAEEVKEQEHKPFTKPQCPKCITAGIREVQLGVRSLRVCAEDCGWKEFKKII